MKSKLIALVSLLLIITGTIEAKAEVVSNSTDTRNISHYLVDISATPVSAGGLVGLTGSAITDVQSAQDLVLAFNPFSTDTSKKGFGIAITPGRTSISPISGMSYVNNPFMRLLGATTLSYAENISTLSGVSYQKYAASIDTSYYLKAEEDPIIINSKEFSKCDERKKWDNNLAEALAIGATSTVVTELREKAKQAWKVCKAASDEKKKWNASKLSLSFGAGRIKPETSTGPTESLGNTVTLGGIFELGDDSAAYISLRNTRHEVDLTTLAGTPAFKNSSLAAVRITQGSENGGDLRWLAEYSNAKATSTTLSSAVFMYAVGIDQKVLPGTWLQFRVGRSRTADGTTTQTTSLLSLNWSPSSVLFGSK